LLPSFSHFFPKDDKMFRTLKFWLSPTISALCGKNLPWTYRWRLLLLQPISILTYILTALPWTFSKVFSVYWIPTRDGRYVRALVYRPSERGSNKVNPGGTRKLRPLHLDIHGGGFLGGLPEYEAEFCSKLSNKTGAVVISTQYRYAPIHTFPAAIDDIDDVIQFLQANAGKLWEANPELMTVGGFSAGGSLALAATQQDACFGSSKTALKGFVGFYASVSSIHCKSNLIY
jgi:acetyl esterase/lipase